jgi:uncharacterized protein (TIGR00251 family)
MDWATAGFCETGAGCAGGLSVEEAQPAMSHKQATCAKIKPIPRLSPPKYSKPFETIGISVPSEVCLVRSQDSTKPFGLLIVRYYHETETSSGREKIFADLKEGLAARRSEERMQMIKTPSFLRLEPDGILLSVKLQPRASADTILGPLGNELRVKVTAPPVDSAANEALVRFLAEVLDCPRNHIQMVRGHTSRHKILKLSGLGVENVIVKLSRAAAD